MSLNAFAAPLSTCAARRLTSPAVPWPAPRQSLLSVRPLKRQSSSSLAMSAFLSFELDEACCSLLGQLILAATGPMPLISEHIVDDLALRRPWRASPWLDVGGAATLAALRPSLRLLGRSGPRLGSLPVLAGFAAAFFDGLAPPIRISAIRTVVSSWRWPSLRREFWRRRFLKAMTVRRGPARRLPPSPARHRRTARRT